MEHITLNMRAMTNNIVRARTKKNEDVSEFKTRLASMMALVCHAMFDD